MSDNTLTLVAVGCSSSKHEDSGKMPAGKRYKGGYWTNKKEYGQWCGDEWAIISAKYAVLSPDQPIAQYEQTVSDIKGESVESDRTLPNGDPVDTRLDEWAAEVYQGLREWIASAFTPGVHDAIQLEILLGKKYTRPLKSRDVFDSLNETPLAAESGDVDNIFDTVDPVTIKFPFRSEVDYSNGGGIGNQRSWMADEVERAKSADVTEFF
jgi:hypothetical protein